MATLAPLGYHKNTELEESAGFDSGEHTEDSVPGSLDYSHATFILVPDRNDTERDAYDQSRSTAE
jgi:hypothetical protein